MRIRTPTVGLHFRADQLEVLATTDFGKLHIALCYGEGVGEKMHGRLHDPLAGVGAVTPEPQESLAGRREKPD